MKRKFLILLTVLLIFAGTLPAGAAFNNSVRDGVVYIEWYGPFIDDDGDLSIGGWSGTGFFVGDEESGAQYIVTNYHVADGLINVDQIVKDNFDTLNRFFHEEYNSDALEEYQYNTSNAKSLFPLYVVFGKNDYEEAYEVAYNKEKDLAILRLDSPTDKRVWLPLRKVSEDFVGAPFYAVGYPGVSDYLWKAVQSYGKTDASVTTGTVNRVITVSGTGMKILQTDVKIRGGNSGGPLVDEDGVVVGINFQSAADWFDPNLNYAICVDELLPLLNNNGIAYTLAGAASAAVITDDESSDTTQSEPSLLSRYWWIFLLIGVVGIAAVCLVIVMRKAKPAAAPQPYSAPMPMTQPVPQPSPYGAPPAQAQLLCTRGHFAGTTFPVSGSLCIGRDPRRCQVIFPGDTQGISSLHCEIRRQGADTFLIDRGSSYGTYLAGGRKLGANESAPLRTGDTFYLADAKNEFKLL